MGYNYQVGRLIKIPDMAELFSLGFVVDCEGFRDSERDTFIHPSMVDKYVVIESIRSVDYLICVRNDCNSFCLNPKSLGLPAIMELPEVEPPDLRVVYPVGSMIKFPHKSALLAAGLMEVDRKWLRLPVDTNLSYVRIPVEFAGKKVAVEAVQYVGRSVAGSYTSPGTYLRFSLESGGKTWLHCAVFPASLLSPPEWEALEAKALREETERRNRMNASILRLANCTSAVDAMRQGVIRCGFELEFQRLNGRNKQDDDDNVRYDEPAIADEIENQINSGDYSDLDIIKVLDSGSGRQAVMGLMELVAMEKEIDDDAVSFEDDILPRFTGKAKAWLEEKFEDAKDNLRRHIRNRNSWEEYILETDTMYSSLDIDEDLRSLIDCGDDGSVKGGEIRTEGPLTGAVFMKIANQLLSRNDFEIDHGCSFHIHISVPGVKHSYGSRAQAELSAFLLRNFHRWPKSLQLRFRSRKREYFEPQIGQDKYRMVHYNCRSKAWEFRLFGNVSTVIDARKSLYLAIEAMRHLYRVKTGLERSLVKALGEIPTLGYSLALQKQTLGDRKEAECGAWVHRLVRNIRHTIYARIKGGYSTVTIDGHYDDWVIAPINQESEDESAA